MVLRSTSRATRVKTDTSERGLENLIVEAMVGRASGEAPPTDEGISSLLKNSYF